MDTFYGLNFIIWLFVVLFITTGVFFVHKVFKERLLPSINFIVNIAKLTQKKNINLAGAYREVYKKRILENDGKFDIKNLKVFAIKDQKFMEKFVNKFHENTKDIPDELMKNKEFCLNILNKLETKYLYKIPVEFSKDKDFVKKAIKIKPEYFQQASNEIKKDKDVCKVAVEKSTSNYFLLEEPLKSDMELIGATLKTYPLSLGRFEEKYKNNEKVVLCALNCAKENKYGDEYISLERVFKNASPRIKKLCKGKDPIKVLTSVVLEKELNGELELKKEKNKVNKI